MRTDDCDPLELQIASGGVCREKRVQRLPNASKDSNASIVDLNVRTAHAQKAVQQSFNNKLVAFAEL